jgi:hypothetical protein
MGISKKECRKHIDPGLIFSPGDGLLIAGQTDHIVRTSVRNIAGKRLLILYFYNRKKAAAGCNEPEYVLFQGRDDYITLQRTEDGNIKWREACLDNLGDRYNYFTNKCAFYRLRDEQIVTRFCKISDKTGFDALNALQGAIMCVRLVKRTTAREQKIINRMKPIPAVPRGLKGWIHREVLPHYIFYDYKRGGKPMEGYCTACRHNVIVSGAKYNLAGICPRCRHSITFKASGKAKRVWDRTTVQVLQKVNGDELALRIFKVYNGLREWRDPNYSIHENARVFVRNNEAGITKIETYYCDYSKGMFTHWIKGERPRFSHYQYNFECDFCGSLYCGNLENTLKDTPWQYSQLGLFCQVDREPMEVLPYLRAYNRYPAIEYLVKLRLTNIAGSIIYSRNGDEIININGKNYKEALGIDAEGLPVMQKINADVQQLELYQHLMKQGVRADEKLLVWYRERGIHEKDYVLIPLRLTTPKKYMRYVDEQFERLKNYKGQYGNRRYEKPDRIASDYKDYLFMGGRLGYDLSDEFVLFPKNLPEAHDQASKLYKNKKTGIFSKMIQQAYADLLEQYRFTKDGFTLIPPKSANEIIKEGHTLHHCVHSYVENVADGKCVVLFIRRTNDVKQPFYTMELRDDKVIQIHGKHHAKPTPEVEKFLEQWKRKKLLPAKTAAAA